MKVSMIAALDAQNAIGSKNQLVWHLPDDFKWFKEHTIGKPMVMGRNTMNSLGRALPKRLNIVVSSTPDNILEGFTYAASVAEALALIGNDCEEVMIIGGGQMYSSMLEKADRLYITKINYSFEQMDTYFPQWNENEWQEIRREHHSVDDRHQYAFDFIILDRIKNGN
jgi:dihydrofolate reductase